MAEGAKRYAVVTGSNQGIGFGTVQLWASKGVKVVLTGLDEKRCLEAIEEIKDHGFAGLVVYHQLDVTDPNSIASLADFVKTQFGKLDILVNDAGIGGTTVDPEAFKAAAAAGMDKLSDSPRVNFQYYFWRGTVNAYTKWMGQRLLSDAENLTEERVDEVLSEFLQDFKEAMLETKGWPTSLSAYIISKVALNAYTRIMAKKYTDFGINCVCPGFVKTEMSFNAGVLTPDEAAEIIVRLTVFPNGNPSGVFFSSEEVSPFRV